MDKRFTPKRDRSGPKPLKRLKRSVYPEVRVNGRGEVIMSYAAFSALPAKNIENMLKEQEKRHNRKTPLPKLFK